MLKTGFPLQMRGTEPHSSPFSFKSKEVCFKRAHEMIAKKITPFRNKVTKRAK